MKIDYSGKSDVGRNRDLNEDSYNAFTAQDGKAYIFIVADGMGGANAGEVASRMAVELFTKKMKKLNYGKMTPVMIRSAMIEAVESANEKIYKKASGNKNLSGMGTTIVAAVLTNDKLIVANVGDSRAYVSSKNNIEAVTQDHSFVHDLFLHGAITASEEKNHPNKNILTRAVGVDEKIEVDAFIYDFPKDSVLLLCSDGLTNMIDDLPMQRIVRRNRNMDKLSARLVTVANEKGGKDNITVIVARRSEEVIRE